MDPTIHERGAACTMPAMKRKPADRDWLPLSRGPRKNAPRAAAEVPTGEAFRPEWIDFDRGIRVGNLEPHERITQILKYRLEQAYDTGFVTDRWGRGVYWQWICWVPRADREAKPVSSGTNFGCAKLFISPDKAARRFQFGMSVERGYISGRPIAPGAMLQEDWDWHRLMRQCAQGTELDAELSRLVRSEGFTASISGAGGGTVLTADSFRSARQLRDAARKAPPDQWAGFDLVYHMPEPELRACSGYELVQAIMGAFAEVVPAMNLCMQVPLASSTRGPVRAPARLSARLPARGGRSVRGIRG
jgi:hypothetical protein